MTTKLLTPREVAQQLRVSTSTLRNWRKQGKGPAVSQIGKAIFRYTEEAIQAYIAQNETARHEWPQE